ncbi:hypothetical protein XpiCFBP4643_07715 [Xanthomonas pisi]|uniref:Uncharacterized protein n=1 Tax=Xanthomonas pisi TaxID=56457 RepID=A0A2S7D4W8_9XANT|nr:hypothetical protein XpiCFBP4643_07715 [Xanthomonas pisi]
MRCCPGWPAQRGIGAPQGASRRVGRQRHGASAARLALAPAKPAPRSTRSAPLTANASHLKVHNTL